VSRDLRPVVHRKLTVLDSAQGLDDLAAVAGNRLEALVSLCNALPALVFFNALVGRLGPGVTLPQARTALEARWPQARQIAAFPTRLAGSSLDVSRRNWHCGPGFCDTVLNTGFIRCQFV